MGQQVAHVEVVGKDADALRAFFGELFGWKFSEPMGPTDYSVLEDQEGVGGGVGAGPEGYPGHVTFYVQVADVGAALETAGRALEETARLAQTQAELYERTIGALREPAEIAKTAVGLERRPRKRGTRQPRTSRPDRK